MWECWTALVPGCVCEGRGVGDWHTLRGSELQRKITRRVPRAGEVGETSEASGAFLTSAPVRFLCLRAQAVYLRGSPRGRGRGSAWDGPGCSCCSWSLSSCSGRGSLVLSCPHRQEGGWLFITHLCLLQAGVHSHECCLQMDTLLRCTGVAGPQWAQVRLTSSNERENSGLY